MPEIPSRLCNSCINIPIRWLLYSARNGYTLFNDFQELLESEKSCDLCKLILRSTRSFDNDDLKAINIVIAPQFLMIECKRKQSGFDYHLLKLCADPGSEAASVGVDIGLPTLPEAGGELYFTLLREWLRDCDENHSDHGIASAIDSELPTRVLNVGDLENSNTLHLYEPNHDSDPERGRYIALSHCWGNTTPLSTTDSTIDDYRKAIEFDRLPKTFQDAVIVARQLGVQYLWIDSLCIIQGNDYDWRRESKNMEKVFASAYCTIAATSAKDSTEGFLIPRSLFKHSVKLVDKSVDNPFYVYACEAGRNFDEDVEKGPLNTRGWVLQERALSPRTIHFTKTQTYWECGSVIRCENLMQMTKPSNLLSSSRFPMTASGPPLGGAASAFEKVFTSYSERDLSFPKDRPYAIAGLERRLTDLYKTESWHGIVRCCLGKSLLWQRFKDEEMMAKIGDHEVKMVPSWSWMKYKGKVCYGNIPKVNTRWNRDIKLASESDPSSNGQEQRILTTPRIRILKGGHIELCSGTNYKIKDVKGRLVGCIRFDDKDEVDIGRLGFIVIAEHISLGWMEQGTREDFGKISFNKGLKLGNLSYTLVVTQAAREQGYEEEVCYRLGVAVIQSDCLSFREQTVWVI